MNSSVCILVLFACMAPVLRSQSPAGVVPQVRTDNAWVKLCHCLEHTRFQTPKQSLQIVNTSTHNPRS